MSTLTEGEQSVSFIYISLNSFQHALTTEYLEDYIMARCQWSLKVTRIRVFTCDTDSISCFENIKNNPEFTSSYKLTKDLKRVLNKTLLAEILQKHFTDPVTGLPTNNGRKFKKSILSYTKTTKKSIALALEGAKHKKTATTIDPRASTLLTLSQSYLQEFLDHPGE